MEKQWRDKELGLVTLRVSARARRYSIKLVRGLLVAVMPRGGDEGTLMAFIEENRPKLKEMLRNHPAADMLSDKTELQTNTFRLHIFCTERSNYYMSLNGGVLNIACPVETDFKDGRVQGLLKGFLEKALRHEARRVLPGRLQALAAQCNFTYSGIRINNSKTRWASCSSRGSINLSLSIMLLPGHLIDYILLHELCHTREMNHSERFWALMDSVTGNKAKQLRQELKGYQILG